MALKYRIVETSDDSAMRLDEIEFLARDLIATHLVGWQFAWDRAATRYGSCVYGTQTITLSRVLNPQRKASAVRNTILHEIAHAMTFGHGHDDVWRAQALALGCNGQRGSDDLETPYNYLGTCPNGHVSKRLRLTDKAKRASCGLCSPHYNPIYKFDWTRV